MIAAPEDPDEWLVWERHPINYGPARQVFETGPVQIVYGAAYRDRARLIATDMFSRGRWGVELVSDEDWTADKAEEANMVLLGAPWENRATKWLAEEIHGKFRSRNLGSNDQTLVRWNTSAPSFAVGSRTFDAAEDWIVFLAPQSLNNPARLALVVAGNSPLASDHIARFIPTFSAARVPDFLVCDGQLSWQGYGSCVSGGYWGARWQWDRASSFGI
jgi:hypothetical protein